MTRVLFNDHRDSADIFGEVAKALGHSPSVAYDGLPLYRIAALLRRSGGDISRNTLAASVVRLGDAVRPIINLLWDHLLDSEIVLATIL